MTVYLVTGILWFVADVLNMCTAIIYFNIHSKFAYVFAGLAVLNSAMVALNIILWRVT